MAVRLTLLDSGGRAIRNRPDVQVTARAYEWWRKLKRAGLAHRVAICKGIYASPGARTQTVSESYPDTSTRVDRNSGARGDVPLYLLNVNALKDVLDGDLKRTEPGPGYVHFPEDLPSSIFDELTAEVRTDRGWEIASNAEVRNEAWDQLAMDVAANLLTQDATGLVSSRDPRARYATTGARIDWSRPPLWAAEPPQNSEVDRHLVPRETATPGAPPSPAAAASRAAAFKPF
jgi:phage terminase large subunit GpA-like protein